MFGENAKRIRKLEEAIDLADQITAIASIEGEGMPERLPDEAVVAIDLGLRVGMTVGKVTAEGKCDGMSAMEIVNRAYGTALSMYVESMASAKEEATENGEG